MLLTDSQGRTRAVYPHPNLEMHPLLRQRNTEVKGLVCRGKRPMGLLRRRITSTATSTRSISTGTGTGQRRLGLKRRSLRASPGSQSTSWSRSSTRPFRAGGAAFTSCSHTMTTAGPSHEQEEPQGKPWRLQNISWSRSLTKPSRAAGTQFHQVK